MFPSAFTEQMRLMLGDEEWRSLEAAMMEPPPVSIRKHAHRRPADPGLLPQPDSQVAWHPEGIYLKERPVFTLDPLFHAGAYYVQEASSMFVYEMLRQTGRQGKSLKVLDLCAAPGGKTTLMYDALDMATSGGLLVANEIVPSRAGILRENLERWGAWRSAVLCADVDKFASLTGFFDVILVDAPCSGEGMFRKDPDAIEEWSPANVNTCVSRQEHILDMVETLLVPGGLLMYSTCTYNRTENEDNFNRHIKQHGYEPVRLQIPADWGVTATDAGYRFFPHKTRGEGFFMAAYEKSTAGEREKFTAPASFRAIVPLPKKQLAVIEPWLDLSGGKTCRLTPTGEILVIPEAHLDDLRRLDAVFKNKWFGCAVGSIKGTDFIPGHALAFSDLLKPQPHLEMTREQALTFLKKETFDPPADAPKGWALATYSGLPLGWVKILPNRMNNYLPAERRIRMSLK